MVRPAQYAACHTMPRRLLATLTRRYALLALAACGSATAPSATGPSAVEQAAQREQAARAERARRATLAAAHRGLEDEQSTALAATCEQPAGAPATRRCLPTCYRAEPPDPRAGARSARPIESQHLACTRTEGSPVLVVDEVLGAARPVRAARGRFPRPHAAGTWQARVEAAVTSALQPEVAKGDVIRVTGAWKSKVHPVTQERLRCVGVSHFARSQKRALDACGSSGKIACEAGGNAAAHGINVVHFRLLEAKRFHAAGNEAACQQAALEAVAVGRGMPRWRQYATLNTDHWVTAARYRTRFDGLLDEDTLFTTAMALGVEAQSLYTTCGGPGNPATTVQQEQSFHTCW